MNHEEMLIKLDYSPTSMEKMRRAVIHQQKRLESALDKAITILIPEGQRLDPSETSLTFRASAYTEIHQIVKEVMVSIRKTIGHAQGLLFDAEVDGFEAIAGVLYSGVVLRTISVPVDRLIFLYHGVMRVTECSERVQQQLNELAIVRAITAGVTDLSEERQAQLILQADNKLYTHEKLFIPAGERVTYEIIHRTWFSTQFIPTPPEKSV